MPSVRSLKSCLLCSVLGSCILAAGCQLTPPFIRLNEVDGTKSEDPWTTQAGTEGRAGRAVEKESDPLNLKKIMMSEKAREIERNCGIE